MQITLQNRTRRMLVVQLAPGIGRNTREDTIRRDYDKDGREHVRRVSIMHPPVLRIEAGGEVQVDASVLRDPNIKRMSAAGARSALRVIRPAPVPAPAAAEPKSKLNKSASRRGRSSKEK